MKWTLAGSHHQFARTPRRVNGIVFSYRHRTHASVFHPRSHHGSEKVKRLRNLSFTEAFESGRPLKRFMDPNWRDPSAGTILVTVEDAKATDWEIKPEPVRLKIYLSPDRTKVSLDVESPYDWDCLQMIEEVKS